MTVTTQPFGQNCVVSDGASSSVIANVTAVTLRCSNRPQYAYVVNNGDNTVSPQAGTVHRSRKYVYVPQLADDTVSQYLIKGDGSLALNTPATVAVGTGGQLMPIATPAVLAANGPAWIAFDPFGKYAYVTNIGNGIMLGSVSEYAIGIDSALSLIASVTADRQAYMIATTF